MNWSWLEIALMAIVGLGVVLALAGAIFLYARRPQFWWDMAIFLGQKFGPAILAALVKLVERMPPEEEAEMRKAASEGRLDEWRKERQQRKMKDYWRKNGTR